MHDPALRVFVHKNRTVVVFFLISNGRSWGYYSCVSSINIGNHPLDYSFFFHLRLTSQNNFRDQGLINFHSVNSWFDTFIRNWRDFMEIFYFFLLMRPLTLEARLNWCYLPVKSYRFCKNSFLKNWNNYLK